MIGVGEDFDSVFEDELFLSAVATAETQHLQQRISNSNYGTGAQDYVGKRKEQWEDSVSNRSGSLQGGNVSPGDKRRRTDDFRGYGRPPVYGQQENGGSFEAQPEGEYMAALRGSNSELWLKSSQGRGSGGFSSRGGASGYAPGAAGGRGGGGASGTCYKCGLEGHWFRDCPKTNLAGGFSAQGGGPLPEQADVPEKNCPCGAGACVVLTASTEKNLGRRFYKCPLKRDEGQCTFFEWCDSGGQGFPTERAATQGFPKMECRCGGGLCVTRTAKTEKNNGRAFYKCPLPQDQACGFFQWCDEAGNDNGWANTAVSSRSFSSSESPAAGACYKCGLSGHWAKDCTGAGTGQSAGGFGNNNAYTPGTKKEYSNLGSGQSPAGGGRTCYICGQEGHSVRDCPKEGGGAGRGGQAYNSTRTPEFKNTEPCYKCGKQGHWSSSCPNSGGDVGVSSAKRFTAGGRFAGGRW